VFIQDDCIEDGRSPGAAASHSLPPLPPSPPTLPPSTSSTWPYLCLTCVNFFVVFFLSFVFSTWPYLIEYLCLTCVNFR